MGCVTIAGGEPKVTVILWRQRLLFPQASVACQVRVATRFVAVRLVIVLRTCTLALLQVSVATGVSNVQATPAATVRSGWQVNVGGVISRIVIVCTHWAELPQASVATQVRKRVPALPQLLLNESLYERVTDPQPS